MDRCPTCGARHAGGPSCHRCRTDLRHVLSVQRAAAGCRREALAALDRGDRAAARERAARACALHRSADNLAAAALAALADRDFPTAVRLWRETRAATGARGFASDS